MGGQEAGSCGVMKAPRRWGTPFTITCRQRHFPCLFAPSALLLGVDWMRQLRRDWATRRGAHPVHFIAPVQSGIVNTSPPWEVPSARRTATSMLLATKRPEPSAVAAPDTAHTAQQGKKTLAFCLSDC